MYETDYELNGKTYNLSYVVGPREPDVGIMSEYVEEVTVTDELGHVVDTDTFSASEMQLIDEACMNHYQNQVCAEPDYEPDYDPERFDGQS